MNIKIGRNAPCPCGSGKKYKKCCLPKDEAKRTFRQIDREFALDKIGDFVADKFYEEDEDAHEEFYAPFPPDPNEKDLDPGFDEMSEAVYEMWFYFDRSLEDGRTVATACWPRTQRSPWENGGISKRSSRPPWESTRSKTSSRVYQSPSAR